jgi:flavin reductase (DIM6/NTAB) family NADH-FMN oxidoreductase RutF
VSGLDTRALRTAFGQFVTGVTVAAAPAPGGAVGVTINSFASLSLEPPLLSWSLATKSDRLPAFRAAGVHALSVLAADQVAVSQRFAGSAAQDFSELDVEAWRTGAPIFTGCLAAFDCRVVEAIEAGDHILFISAIEDFGLCAPEKEPLTFFRSGYGRTPSSLEESL